MLLASRANDWATEDYIHPAHPMQEAVERTVKRFVGAPHPTAIDGCGVPTFWLSMRQMATAWAHLAAAMADPDRDPLLARIGEAMSSYPELTSGVGRIDLAVAQRATGPFVGKIGALGVFCVAWPERRIGVAIKVHSGNEDALAVAIDAIVSGFCEGALAPADRWPWHAVSNVAGRIVGQRRLIGLPDTHAHAVPPT
jgi:L-asparaginase II